MRYKRYFRKTSLKQKGVGDFFLNEILAKKPKFFSRSWCFSWSDSKKCL